MKDEIKEILDRVKKHYVLDETQDDLLLDNITNLQQEINKLTAESTEWESKCYELQEENEILKEDYSKAMELIDKGVENSYKMLKDYKSRCEKAIEYIEENNFHYMNEYALERFRNNLLNILQNGSEENG